MANHEYSTTLGLCGSTFGVRAQFESDRRLVGVHCAANLEERARNLGLARSQHQDSNHERCVAHSLPIRTRAPPFWRLMIVYGV